MVITESVIDFPSVEWFDFLCDHAKEEPEIYESLGFAFFKLAVELVDEGGRVQAYGIVFDGYDVISFGDVTGYGNFQPDATISGPLAAWREMVNNISANGGADSAHTLNALSIAEVPFQVRADDPLGKDKFFRYAETLQTIFDATSRDGESIVII